MTEPTEDRIEAAAPDLIAAGVRHATEKGLKLSIAVTDRGGHLVAYQRMPGASPGSGQLAIRKAQSAILMGRATGDWTPKVEANRALAMTLSDAGVIPLAGGVPLGGTVREGAVGVSGGNAEQDGLAAEEVARAFATRE